MSYKPESSTGIPFSDLHCHSHCSDGELSPTALVELARERAVEVLAITDHDSVAAISEAREAAREREVTLVSGTELTCFWGRRVVHIVGLGFDETAPELLDYLARLSVLRTQRAELIAKKLQKAGLPDVLGRAAELAGDGQLGRPHFAQALVEAGAVVNEMQAFNRYLGAGKTGDVKVEWPDMSEGIAVLKRAGGVAVLAHPTKYNLTFTKIRLLVDAFSEAGGDGLEISYPGVESGHIQQLDRLAEKYDLFVSAGSDFHKHKFHWTALGKYPRFSSENKHVLSQLL